MRSEKYHQPHAFENRCHSALLSRILSAHYRSEQKIIIRNILSRRPKTTKNDSGMLINIVFMEDFRKI